MTDNYTMTLYNDKLEPKMQVKHHQFKKYLDIYNLHGKPLAMYKDNDLLILEYLKSGIQVIAIDSEGISHT